MSFPVSALAVVAATRRRGRIDSGTLRSERTRERGSQVGVELLQPGPLLRIKEIHK